ncbi:MAG: hypothetical protein WCI51_02150 [Lentisphaerota bacterium]
MKIENGKLKVSGIEGKQPPKLTKADERIIETLPEGWFKPEDLSYAIRCREYRCQRLERAGILQSRVAGKNIYSLYSEYCKK